MWDMVLYHWKIFINSGNFYGSDLSSLLIIKYLTQTSVILSAYHDGFLPIRLQIVAKKHQSLPPFTIAVAVASGHPSPLVTSQLYCAQPCGSQHRPHG